jgi:hypothetical protein
MFLWHPYTELTYFEMQLVTPSIARMVTMVCTIVLMMFFFTESVIIFKKIKVLRVKSKELRV